jgi:Uma2 family endonuclease
MFPMTVAAVALAQDEPLADEDRFVITHGVDWKTYCAVRELFDSPGLRMTYLNGALEIMSPSRKHEGFKTRIARLIEMYAIECDVPLLGYGSTTFRKSFGDRGLEPDECYVVGRDLTDDDYPDIALEIILTSGGINKLDVYQGLGVREVWFWQKQRFLIYRLGDSGYELRPRSDFLPDLDFEALTRYVEAPDQHAALRAYRDALRVR